jgi:hypothetical protein
MCTDRYFTTALCRIGASTANGTMRNAQVTAALTATSNAM